jgi:undecaprenyl phosphate N,N'-diacetylbacillosamine 1-phosphate transferase
MYNFFFKRLIDFLLSLIAIIILSPLLIIICIVLVKANNNFGVFFIQTRTGKNAQLFKILKYKTMSDLKDTNGKLMPDELRISPIGKFLRSTSLDELPQLFNVLKGDMSLIGPRPLLEKYIPLYSKYQFKRHNVRPGITGWAQVNGRNNISWTKKFELDVWYVDNQSMLLDIKIFWLTLMKVIKRKDITSEDPTTFQPFNGKN